jgi:hypothetical protein
MTVMAQQKNVSARGRSRFHWRSIHLPHVRMHGRNESSIQCQWWWQWGRRACGHRPAVRSSTRHPRSRLSFLNPSGLFVFLEETNLYSHEERDFVHHLFLLEDPTKLNDNLLSSS